VRALGAYIFVTISSICFAHLILLPVCVSWCLLLEHCLYATYVELSCIGSGAAERPVEGLGHEGG